MMQSEQGEQGAQETHGMCETKEPQGIKNVRSSYRARILRSGKDLPVKDFCKDYGWSTRKMNSWLWDHEMQAKVTNGWEPELLYENLGYVFQGVSTFMGPTGLIHPTLLTFWTPEGRAYIYDTLRAEGILPLEERDCA